MSSFVIGTIKTRLKGETIPYYPETMGEAVTLPNPNGAEGETTTLQALIDSGALSGGTPLQHKDGHVEATEDGQKVFKVELAPDMPPLEKMGLDVHVKSTWYSPTRYTAVGSNIILNDNEAGLKTGDLLEYTLHYGKVAGSSISMDRQVIEVKEKDTNVFTITKGNYNPARYSILAVVGTTVVVPERLTIGTAKDGYTVTFNDYNKFDVGKIITLLFFYDTPPTGVINGGSLTQFPVSSVMQKSGRIIPIPLEDYTFKKYTVLLFINSTFIAPRKYTIDELNKRIILKDSEEEISAGKTIDFIFTAIQKDIDMVENMEFEKLKELMKYRTRTLNSSKWVADSTYSEFPYSYTITDYDILAEHVIHATFPMSVALKYSGIICSACETIESGFKVYAYEIPKEDISIKYLIGR